MYAKYQTDIESALKITQRADVPFLLVSPASEGQHDSWQRLDTLYRSITADHQLQFQYVDGGAQIAPDGDFAATQRCLPSELGVLCTSDDGTIGVRAADGVLFCDHPSATTPASPCSQYASGAVRDAIALVAAARIDLDYLDTLSTPPPPTEAPRIDRLPRAVRRPQRGSGGRPKPTWAMVVRWISFAPTLNVGCSRSTVS
jgi:hypothetical protein